MALPLAVRNRLAELILDAFEDREAREILDALARLCGGTEAGALDEATLARLATLGWIRPCVDGAVRFLGVIEPHRDALCRRVEAARAALRPRATAEVGDRLAVLLDRAAALADQGLHFEVHELLEPAWFRAEGAERLGLQALIQIAVALHHLENGNLDGAVSLLGEGLAKLAAAEPVLPLDTSAWAADLHAMLAALREGRRPAPALPWPRPRETAWRSS